MASAKTAQSKVKQKKKVRKNIAAGIAHIQSTFNNTVVTITDINGNAVAWSSAVARIAVPVRVKRKRSARSAMAARAMRNG